ncbi:hypothetical protein [Lacticaseibacillus hegangensis]|uniref:Uncharacterized protein n=1 Tax=Lacticaseibacillus hegangensis TaxID=2486010 RepID=A0ABW4CYR1_9LACO|nr:hypothetical protein [Lacticaseibacillus hegangensis]
MAQRKETRRTLEVDGFNQSYDKLAANHPQPENYRYTFSKVHPSANDNEMKAGADELIAMLPPYGKVVQTGLRLRIYSEILADESTMAPSGQPQE